VASWVSVSVSGSGSGLMSSACDISLDDDSSAGVDSGGIECGILTVCMICRVVSVKLHPQSRWETRRTSVEGTRKLNWKGPTKGSLLCSATAANVASESVIIHPSPHAEPFQSHHTSITVRVAQSGTMPATEELVAGAGWVSDDSSFYGECNNTLQLITSFSVKLAAVTNLRCTRRMPDVTAISTLLPFVPACACSSQQLIILCDL
jgi:hypothetical protein